MKNNLKNHIIHGVMRIVTCIYILLSFDSGFGVESKNPIQLSFESGFGVESEQHILLFGDCRFRVGSKNLKHTIIIIEIDNKQITIGCMSKDTDYGSLYLLTIINAEFEFLLNDQTRQGFEAYKKENELCNRNDYNYPTQYLKCGLEFGLTDCYKDIFGLFFHRFGSFKACYNLFHNKIQRGICKVLGIGEIDDFPLRNFRFSIEPVTRGIKPNPQFRCELECET